ncbi:antirepressor [Rodentibacter trehalosifermentans]|uniref:Antirepressor n=1 Tax=Rodentibacter trehalosifermentans TaxID=1908263 RepID=A0A1V3IZI1_9PAST|nr:antA/AntB antirepressor family protein [Rodentibacter trehalosifermentans]OOF47917.1 antirepressor [Rodentibacter trehalosifermentans]
MKNEILNLLQPGQAEEGEHYINAREVHRLLQVGRDYSNWIKARIKQAGFIEHQDFEIVKNLSSPKLASANNEQSSPMARPQKLIDYIITLDTAKHLCLMEKNEIGRAIRQHFIEAEKQLKRIAPKIYKNTLAQTRARLESIDRNREMTDAIKAQLARAGKTPKPFYYSRENEMLDSLILGVNVRQWKSARGFMGNVRQSFNVAQLNTLKTLQATNTALINLDLSYHERKGHLSALAKRTRA